MSSDRYAYKYEIAKQFAEAAESVLRTHKIRASVEAKEYANNGMRWAGVSIDVKGRTPLLDPLWRLLGKPDLVKLPKNEKEEKALVEEVHDLLFRRARLHLDHPDIVTYTNFVGMPKAS